MLRSLCLLVALSLAAGVRSRARRGRRGRQPAPRAPRGRSGRGCRHRGEPARERALLALPGRAGEALAASRPLRAPPARHRWSLDPRRGIWRGEDRLRARRTLRGARGGDRSRGARQSRPRGRAREDGPELRARRRTATDGCGCRFPPSLRAPHHRHARPLPLRLRRPERGGLRRARRRRSRRSRAAAAC